jgi:hypothetical protein
MTGDTGLSPEEARTLRCVAGMMIPASARHGVPGADDPVIFADIVRSLGRDIAHVRAALGRLDELAGGDFAGNASRRAEAVARFRAEGGAPEMFLNRAVLQCYYRDDRVMRALGMDPRPPFPRGFAVEQGDWSLLDPVRARAPFWRKAPQ